MGSSVFFRPFRGGVASSGAEPWSLAMRFRNSSCVKISTSRSVCRGAGVRRSKLRCLPSGIRHPASCRGTSVLMVARNFEKRIFSAFSMSFRPMAPLMPGAASRRASMLLYSVRSLIAVFSPTPGQPGILSAASPISPSMSITCSVRSRPYLAHTSSGPRCSMPFAPFPGRHMVTPGRTSWA